MEKYRILHVDREIGTLWHGENGKNKVEFIDGLTLYNLPTMFYYLYKEKGQRVFEGVEVEEFIESRGFERGRMNLTEILMELGMKEYDPWEILKAFDGKTASDDYRVERVE